MKTDKDIIREQRKLLARQYALLEMTPVIMPEHTGTAARCDPELLRYFKMLQTWLPQVRRLQRRVAILRERDAL